MSNLDRDIKNQKARENLCPVCGYELGFPPWNGLSPADEICPCCGIQFGYDDVEGGGEMEGTPEQIYIIWRNRWIEKGMLWFSRGRFPPPHWDPHKQLERIGIKI